MKLHAVTRDVEASDLDASYLGRLITFGKKADIASTVLGVFHGQLRSVKHDTHGTEVGLIGPTADPGDPAGPEKVLVYRLPHDTAIELD
ncbi:hypothetical protein SEA_LIGMA_85 [Gordonia phage Ligma]|nr:hypothetical protein SEA_LIGMA_85 [Gordonia phage Ligma]UQT02184.1 hypothetical protein SEA_AXUMITE_85 [Gordonia phage Axumite]